VVDVDPTDEGSVHPSRRGWRDAWLDATTELVVGCVLLVLSGAFWTSKSAGPIWDLHHWPTNVGAVLGPWFVYRAWKRR
jgi:hypothetical protein